MPELRLRPNRKCSEEYSGVLKKGEKEKNKECVSGERERDLGRKRGRGAWPQTVKD